MSRLPPFLLACLMLCACNAPAPDDSDEHAVGGNAEVIAALREAGTDLAQPQEVEFFFYFPDADKAEVAASTLGGLGYRTQLDDEADEDGGIGLLARRKTLVTEATIDQLEVDLVKVADAGDGIYDGWGVEIVE